MTRFGEIANESAQQIIVQMNRRVSTKPQNSCFGPIEGSSAEKTGQGFD